MAGHCPRQIWLLMLLLLTVQKPHRIRQNLFGRLISKFPRLQPSSFKSLCTSASVIRFVLSLFASSYSIWLSGAGSPAVEVVGSLALVEEDVGVLVRSITKEVTFGHLKRLLAPCSLIKTCTSARLSAVQDYAAKVDEMIFLRLPDGP